MMQRLVPVFLVVLGCMVPFCGASASQDCDCGQVSEHTANCYISMWKHHADAQPRTLDDLESLLDTLREGTKADLQELEKAGCGADERAEACGEHCLQDAWKRYYRLITEAQEPVVRWGAVTLAFETYMDIGVPEEVRAQLEEVSRTLLNAPPDPVTIAALLRMMELYKLGSPEVVAGLLEQMMNPDPLIRQLSYDRFSQYTGARLRFDTTAEPKERQKQVDKMRRWWNNHQPSKRAKEGPSR